MRFMQIESVLQTKNRSEPAKNRFSVALVATPATKTVVPNSDLESMIVIMCKTSSPPLHYLHRCLPKRLIIHLLGSLLMHR